VIIFSPNGTCSSKARGLGSVPGYYKICHLKLNKQESVSDMQLSNELTN